MKGGGELEENKATYLPNQNIQGRGTANKTFVRMPNATAQEVHFLYEVPFGRQVDIIF